MTPRTANIRNAPRRLPSDMFCIGVVVLPYATCSPKAASRCAAGSHSDETLERTFHSEGDGPFALAFSISSSIIFAKVSYGCAP